MPKLMNNNGKKESNERISAYFDEYINLLTINIKFRILNTMISKSYSNVVYNNIDSLQGWTLTS